MALAFVDLCAEEDIAVGEMRRFEVAARSLALYHLEEGFYATAAICTHEYAQLTLGELEGRRVTCPLHGARFDVVTGRVLSPPAFKPLKTFPTRVRAGRVEVELG